MKDNTKDLLIEQLEKQNDKLITERDKLELTNKSLINQLLEVTRTLNSCMADLKETKNKQKTKCKMKKLIFLKDGEKSRKLLKLFYVCPNRTHSAEWYIHQYGYEEAINEIKELDHEWIMTETPTVLRSIDWWNEDEQKFEIYIPTEKGKLKNIQEFTDKVIRHTHNIENLFLGGVFDD